MAVVIASEDIRRSTGTHPSGITGISVECAVELSVAELAMTIPHAQVGVTIVVRCDRPMEMLSVLLGEAKIMQP